MINVLMILFFISPILLLIYFYLEYLIETKDDRKYLRKLKKEISILVNKK